MNTLLEYLANPYFAAAVAGAVTFLIMYIDAKITKKQTPKKTYTKNVILVALLCGTLVYILGNTVFHPQISKLTAATTSSSSTNAATVGVSYDTSDILIGEPKF